jgi:hypothetical protein
MASTGEPHLFSQLKITGRCLGLLSSNDCETGSGG